MKKKRKMMLCGVMTLVMALVMAMPISASAAEVEAGNYDALQGAISSATEATTIKLTGSIIGNIEIPSGKDITIDLNGQTITNSTDHTIINRGTLTIIGSGTVDNISNGKAALYNDVGAIAVLNGGEFTRSLENGQSASESGGNSYYAVLNHGEMTINNGVSVTQNGHYSSLLENGWQDGTKNSGGANSKLTINGGTFSGGLNTIKNDDYGELTINGGMFTNVSQAAVLNWNQATINDGTFEISGDETAAVILNGYINNTMDMDKGVLNIYGGDFIGEVSIQTMGGSSNSGVVSVYDGNFAGAIELNNGINISGGIFASVPENALIDEDSIHVEYNGKHIIGDENYVKDNMGAVQSGKEIVVHAGNISFTGLPSGTIVTNAGNGNVTANGIEVAANGTVTIEKPETTIPSQQPTEQTSSGTTASDKVPTTGDDFNMTALLAIMGSAAAAAAGSVIYGKKRRHS